MHLTDKSITESVTVLNPWTRDQDGNYVDWTKPPYRGPGGRLSLLVAGESPRVLEDPAEHHKRIAEYYRLVKR